VSPIERLVDPVTRGAAGEQARQRVAREAVRCQRVRLVRHRDDDARAAPSALTLDECRENLDHRR